jgi:hypothetical protein
MSKKRRRRSAERRQSREQFAPEFEERTWTGREDRHAGRRERDRRRGRSPEPVAAQRSTAVEPAPAARRRPRDDIGSLTPLAEHAWDALLAPSRIALTCGGCRNWLAHTEPGGRGSCDHPASGFSYPYEDTPACPFFEARWR